MSEILISVTPQNIYSTCTRIESVIPFFLSWELKQWHWWTVHSIVTVNSCKNISLSVFFTTFGTWNGFISSHCCNKNGENLPLNSELDKSSIFKIYFDDFKCMFVNKSKVCD